MTRSVPNIFCPKFSTTIASVPWRSRCLHGNLTTLTKSPVFSIEPPMLRQHRETLHFAMKRDNSDLQFFQLQCLADHHVGDSILLFLPSLQCSLLPHFASTGSFRLLFLTVSVRSSLSVVSMDSQPVTFLRCLVLFLLRHCIVSRSR